MNPILFIRWGSGGYVARLNRSAMQLIDSREIIFDKRNFIIRIPTFSDNKTFKISKIGGGQGIFNFGNLEQERPEIVGEYLIEKDGDDYILSKQSKDFHYKNRCTLSIAIFSHKQL